MAGLIPLAEQRLAEAERAIDGLWTPISAVASRHPRGGTSTKRPPTHHTVGDAVPAARGHASSAHHSASPPADNPHADEHDSLDLPRPPVVQCPWPASKSSPS